MNDYQGYFYVFFSTVINVFLGFFWCFSAFSQFSHYSSPAPCLPGTVSYSLMNKMILRRLVGKNLEEMERRKGNIVKWGWSRHNKRWSDRKWKEKGKVK